MAVKIRLSRIGKKHVPFFRIIAIDSRKKRDGAYLENLGTYDVHNNTFVQFHEERINHWVSKGAVVTDSVKKLQREYKQESGVASKKATVVAPKAKTVAVDAQESKN
jgi:small subunit ribosomal protein S16